MTTTSATVASMDQLIADLVGAWGSWAPTLSPDGSRVAFLSDRGGRPQLWVCDADPLADGEDSSARLIDITADPVTAVSWSADGEWLACSVAPGGGVRTHIWVVQPDGSRARCVAGSAYEHARLGPWSRQGQQLVVSIPPDRLNPVSRCYLVDPPSGEREWLAEGGLVEVLDLSADGRFALLRDGRRGEHFCVTLDRAEDNDYPLLPYPHTGSTESGLVRPAAWDRGEHLTAYLITDAGQPRAVLAGVDLGPQGLRGSVGVLAARADGELEMIDADDAGRVLLLVWNVGGRSEVELFDTASEKQIPVPGLPGVVVNGCVLARNGESAVLSVEGPLAPSALWRLDLTTRAWSLVDTSPASLPADLVEPTLEHLVAYDGLPLTGWLYRPPRAEDTTPVLLSFHGGPEAQERPTFNPQHQAVVAAGIAVFAPNVRGSTGYGRRFSHADDRNGRYNAIADVAACADHLITTGIADADRVAVSGRSYGGYLALAALVRFPRMFAAGVDICGMSDLLTFYRDTEPWIAAAAVTKYGHPEHDRALLEDLSPLARAEAIQAPLLVVHGEHDTNVPIGEAHQMVAALRRLGRPVEYLELPGEGHEYRRRSSRRTLISRLVSFVGDHLCGR